MIVALTIGRMNPPTKGHIYLLSKLLEKKAEKYLLVLQGENLKDNEFKNIFSQELKSEIIKNSSLRNLDKLEIVTSSNAYLPDIANKFNLTTEDKMIVVLGEEDAETFNKRQIPYIPEEILSDMPKFEIVSIPMKQLENQKDRISGTLVREYIFSNDFQSFFNTVDIKDENIARKLFEKLREAVIENLKQRFEYEEINNKLNFKLPKTKRGEFNSAANKAINNIFLKLKNYDKEIIYENLIKENPDRTFFTKKYNNSDNISFVITNESFFYISTKNKQFLNFNGKWIPTEYNQYREWNHHGSLLKLIELFCKKNGEYEHYQQIFEETDVLFGRVFFGDKKSNNRDILTFWGKKEYVLKFPLLKNFINSLDLSEEIYLDFELCNDELKDPSFNIVSSKNLSHKSNDIRDRDLSLVQGDYEQAAIEKWRQKIYQKNNVFEQLLKENPDTTFFNISYLDYENNITFIITNNNYFWGNTHNCTTIWAGDIQFKVDKFNIFSHGDLYLWMKKNNFLLKGENQHNILQGRIFKGSKESNNRDIISFWNSKQQALNFYKLKDFINNMNLTNEIYIDFILMPKELKNSEEFLINKDDVNKNDIRARDLSLVKGDYQADAMEKWRTKIYQKNNVFESLIKESIKEKIEKENFFIKENKDKIKNIIV